MPVYDVKKRAYIVDRSYDVCFVVHVGLFGSVTALKFDYNFIKESHIDTMDE